MTVAFVDIKNSGYVYGQKLNKKILSGLPEELLGKIKYLYVQYNNLPSRYQTGFYELSDDAVGVEVSISFNTEFVSVGLLSANQTEVAQGIIWTSYKNISRLENVSIDINLNQWINSDLAFVNLPGAWSLPAGNQTKWYKVKLVADDHGGNFYQNVFEFCKFIILNGKMALSIENVWLPYFEPTCLQLNCPSVTIKPTIEITLTDDTGKEWKFNFEINSFTPFFEDTPVALYYQR